MNLSKILRNLQNGRHFKVRGTFKPEVVPEVEFNIKIGHAIAYILSFFLTSWPSCMAFDLQKLYTEVIDNIPYVDQVSC